MVAHMPKNKSVGDRPTIRLFSVCWKTAISDKLLAHKTELNVTLKQSKKEVR